MNLYEINHAIMECMEEFDEETGELLNAEMLDALIIAREEKIENVACWIKNLNAEAEAIKAEKRAFEKRQKAAENKAGQLKDYLSKVLNGEKFKTPRVAISFRMSESVKVEDWRKLDKKYLKYGDPDVDKMEVKKALKGGADLDGVCLVKKNSIQIR